MDPFTQHVMQFKDTAYKTYVINQVRAYTWASEAEKKEFLEKIKAWPKSFTVEGVLDIPGPYLTITPLATYLMYIFLKKLNYALRIDPKKTETAKTELAMCIRLFNTDSVVKDVKNKPIVSKEALATCLDHFVSTKPTPIVLEAKLEVFLQTDLPNILELILAHNREISKPTDDLIAEVTAFVIELVDTFEAVDTPKEVDDALNKFQKRLAQLRPKFNIEPVPQCLLDATQFLKQVALVKSGLVPKERTDKMIDIQTIYASTT